MDPELDAKAKEEITWCFRSLKEASTCCTLVLFLRGRCIAHMGAAALRCNGAQATAGTMCQSIVGEDKGNYIPNLAVYPGKIEFTYLPSTAQALVLQPLGEAGVMLVCSDTQKGFTKLDLSWIACLSEKLDVTLDA